MPRRHVYRDIRPYVCTFETCDNKMFDSRHAWFNHELETHRLQWRCPTCDHAPFTSKPRFIAHMQTHLPDLDPAQLEQLAGASRPRTQISMSECPLCDWQEQPNPGDDSRDQSNVTVQQFRRHLGRHMEQLALFALPKSLTQDVDDDAERSDGVQNAESQDVSRVARWR